MDFNGFSGKADHNIEANQGWGMCGDTCEDREVFVIIIPIILIILVTVIILIIPNIVIIVIIVIILSILIILIILSILITVKICKRSSSK